MSSGAIAQLGERLLCKQEVVGSIPSGSTTLDASLASVGQSVGDPASDRAFKICSSAENEFAHVEWPIGPFACACYLTS